MDHQYIKTNDITLHVVQAGPTDGPLVILLHGFPEFWYGWR
jgi:epoxide hydrolase 4